MATATISKFRAAETGAERWMVSTDEGYQTLIAGGREAGPEGPCAALATREPHGPWVWHKEPH